jgi:hypothetical protein
MYENNRVLSLINKTIISRKTTHNNLKKKKTKFKRK